MLSDRKISHARRDTALRSRLLNMQRPDLSRDRIFIALAMQEKPS